MQFVTARVFTNYLGQEHQYAFAGVELTNLWMLSAKPSRNTFEKNPLIYSLSTSEMTMFNYLVLKSNPSTGERHKADAISVEPSGALIFRAGHKGEIVYAYAPGHWHTVQKMANDEH